MPIYMHVDANGKVVYIKGTPITAHLNTFHEEWLGIYMGVGD